MNKTYDEINDPNLLGKGRWLSLRKTREGWEYCERNGRAPVVAVVALTEEQEFLLVEQYRPAVQATVIECPAGLVDEGESAEQAAARELLEETGYGGGELTLLCDGPVSPGLTNESVSVFIAVNLKKMSDSVGVDGERITVRKVPMRNVEEFIAGCKGNGLLIGPRTVAELLYVYAKLVLAGCLDQFAKVVDGQQKRIDAGIAEYKRQMSNAKPQDMRN